MSVYEKFLDNYKSKLCESKSKKVSLKKLKKVNENQVESDETVLEKVYTNQNVKETLRIDKCYMDDGTIEYVVNCNILGVEEWFTDFSKAKEYYYEIMDEFKREVDNYYEDDDDDDDTIDESAKARFLKKAFSKSKLSESRTLKRTRKLRVSINEAYYAYKPMDTFYKKLKDTSDNIDFCIDTLKTMQNPVTDKDKKEYEKLSDEAKKSISKITRNDLEKAYNIIMDIMRKLP